MGRGEHGGVLSGISLHVGSRKVDFAESVSTTIVVYSSSESSFRLLIYIFYFFIFFF